MNVVTNPISASDPVLSCRVNEIGIVVNETGLFTVSVSLIDSFTAQIVQNISWQVILKHIERHYISIRIHSKTEINLIINSNSNSNSNSKF